MVPLIIYVKSELTIVFSFPALSDVAENYYNAIKKIGEQALQNSACHGLGKCMWANENKDNAL